MSIQPWMEEYKKWNINPEFTRPDPEKTLSTTIAENLVKFQDKTAFFIWIANSAITISMCIARNWLAIYRVLG